MGRNSTYLRLGAGLHDRNWPTIVHTGPHGNGTVHTMPAGWPRPGAARAATCAPRRATPPAASVARRCGQLAWRSSGATDDHGLSAADLRDGGVPRGRWLHRRRPGSVTSWIG